MLNSLTIRHKTSSAKTCERYRRSNLFFGLALLFFITIITTSILGYWLFHYQILVNDEWVIYKRYINQPFLQSIWATWNGHRLFFPGILERLNLEWFHADLGNLVVLNVAFQAASAWLLSRAVTVELECKQTRWLTTALVLTLMLCLENQHGLNWAFGLTYTLGILGAVSACYCLLGVSKADNSGFFWLATSLTGGILTSLSWGSGIVIWPILLLMGIALRLSRTILLTVVIVGIVIIVIFLMPAPGDFSPPIPMPGNPIAAFTQFWYFGAGFLSSFPAHLIWHLQTVPTSPPYALFYFSNVVAALAWGLLIWLIILWWHQRNARQWLLTNIGIALFIFGTMFLAAIVRGDEITKSFGGSHNEVFALLLYGLVPRYRIFSCLLWATLLSGVLSFWAWHQPGNRSRLVFSVTICVFSVLLIPSQLQNFMHAGKKSSKLREASLTLATGANDRWAILGSLYFFNQNLVLGLTPYLSRHHLTIFRYPWAHWEGTSLEGTNKATVKSMQGGLSSSRKAGRGFKIHGWVGTSHRRDFIVGIDGNNRIRAMAIPAHTLAGKRYSTSPELPFWLNMLHATAPNLQAILGWGRGWQGYVSGRYNPRNLQYFVVNRHKRIIAELAH